MRNFEREAVDLSSNNVWWRAQRGELRVSCDMRGEINIGFDRKIPEYTKEELKKFVRWAESRFHFPIDLWVDFEYRHYLVSRDGRRVGFLFYWTDFSEDLSFDKVEDIPMIRLPVRTERSSMEEVLTSFIEAVTCYFAWIVNEMCEGYTPSEEDVGEILRAYLRNR